ncbi:MAG: small multidrug resistance family (SMR) protein, partial [uncultured Solirubrobacterales bacterium]
DLAAPARGDPLRGRRNSRPARLRGFLTAAPERDRGRRLHRVVRTAGARPRTRGARGRGLRDLGGARRRPGGRARPAAVRRSADLGHRRGDRGHRRRRRSRRGVDRGSV